jgi:hypothetical protein
MAVDPNLMMKYLAQMQGWQAMQQQRDNRSARRSGDNQLQLLMQLLQGTQGRYEDARQANEDRYLDILEGKVGTRNRVLGDIAGYGQNQIDRANESWNTQRSNLLTDLAQRGFSQSTARIPVEESVARGRADQLGNINDRLTMMRTGADERLSNNAMDFMERRNDSYPQGPDLSAAMMSMPVGSGGGGPVQGIPGRPTLQPGVGGRPQPLGGIASPPGRQNVPSTQPIGMGWGPGGPNPPAPQQPANKPMPLGGMFSQAATFRPPSFPSAPPVDPREQMRQAEAAQQAAQKERARRGSMLNLKQAYDTAGGYSGVDRMRRAEDQAILHGFGNWSPNQTVPTARVAPSAYTQPFNAPSPYAMPQWPYQNPYAMPRPFGGDGSVAPPPGMMYNYGPGGAAPQANPWPQQQMPQYQQSPATAHPWPQQQMPQTQQQIGMQARPWPQYM